MLGAFVALFFFFFSDLPLFLQHFRELSRTSPKRSPKLDMRKINGKSKLTNSAILFKVFIEPARLHQECCVQLLSPLPEKISSD